MLTGYFKILEVQPTTDVDLIKVAYKKVASKYHPDKNLQNKQWAEEKFKLVSEAYRLIIDQFQSTITSEFDGADAFYNSENFKNFESKIPNYWDTIRNNKDPNDQVVLMLHELEAENYKEGLKLFDRMAEEMVTIDPLSLLESKNYFDACYLLAEALDKDRRYLKALEYYAIYYQHIRIFLHQRDFAQELKDKIVKTYKTKVCRLKNKSDCIQYYLRLLSQVSFTNKEKAKILKDMVKLYLENNEFDKAVATIEEALKLDPRLTGLKQIKTQLQTMEKS
jgi:tetratricopeptide (TPR) repeat protein